MMNWKGFLRKRSWLKQGNAGTAACLEGEENHEKLQSRKHAVPRFEMGVSRKTSPDRCYRHTSLLAYGVFRTQSSKTQQHIHLWRQHKHSTYDIHTTACFIWSSYSASLNIIKLYINKIQRDETVCRRLFTAKLLYMFRVSIAPIIRSTSNCNCSFWYRS